MGDLTENFSRHEFACKCDCGFDAIDLGLVGRLQLIRDIVRVPLIVLSGCRCPQHNVSVGGVIESFHTLGQAVDWTIECGDGLLQRLCEHLLDNWSGGFHWYETSRFVHTDVGPRRRWA